MTAIILAGGENRRMASPKSSVEIGGVAIIELQIRALGALFDEIMVVSNDPGEFVKKGLRVVPDAELFRDIKGPMTGVYSGLSAMRGETGFVVACDMPFIRPALVAWMGGLMAGRDAVAPKVNGHVEPLFGYYGKRCLRKMEGFLQKGERSLQALLDEVDTRYVSEAEIRLLDPGLFSLFNVNTPEDLKRAEALSIGFQEAGGTP